MAWDVSDYLLADQADSLRWLVWAKTKDARKNRKKPQPIPRPADARRRVSDVESMNVTDMKAFLAKRRTAVD